MNTGEKIVYQRKKHSITQEDLANQVGVSRQTVSKWEGNLALPDTASIDRLATLFDVSTDYLIRDKVDEKEHVSQKKALSINLGLLIGFLALNLLGFVLAIVTAYATYKALNGVIVFLVFYFVSLVGAIILLSIYKSRCAYDENDRRFLSKGTIGTLFAGIFTFGMFLPLPICDNVYNTAAAPSIVSIELYWSWAFAGGAIALALAFLVLPFILSKGRLKNGNKEATDGLFLGCFVSAAFLIILTGGAYETKALIGLHETTTIATTLIAFTLIVLLAIRGALPLRSRIIAPLLILGGSYWFYVYFSTLDVSYYQENRDISIWIGFAFFAALALYLLVEGIIALKRKKDFFFMLSFICFGGELLFLFSFSMLSPSSSLAIAFLIGYLTLIVSLLPGLLLAIHYDKIVTPKTPAEI
jgi:transcriptional regulator with XRE-family HTH domain